jgi:hypothetical protein
MAIPPRMMSRKPANNSILSMVFGNAVVSKSSFSSILYYVHLFSYEILQPPNGLRHPQVGGRGLPRIEDGVGQPHSTPDSIAKK